MDAGAKPGMVADGTTSGVRLPSVPPSVPPSPPGAECTRPVELAGLVGLAGLAPGGAGRGCGGRDCGGAGCGEEGEGVAEAAGSQLGAMAPGSSSLRDLLAQRLGRSNGSMVPAEALLDLVKRLSAAMAEQLRRFAGGVVAEVGQLVLAFVDLESSQFLMELLLPWGSMLALIDPLTKRAPLEVMDPTTASGFCAVHPSRALGRLFDYTIRVSSGGLPSLVARLWRTIATAVPALHAGEPAVRQMESIRWRGGHPPMLPPTNAPTHQRSRPLLAFLA